MEKDPERLTFSFTETFLTAIKECGGADPNDTNTLSFTRRGMSMIAGDFTS